LSSKFEKTKYLNPVPGYRNMAAILKRLETFFLPFLALKALTISKSPRSTLRPHKSFSELLKFACLVPERSDFRYVVVNSTLFVAGVLNYKLL
jgi:hypothetical protein